MAVFIKNQRLKNRIFKQIRKNENLAIKNYSQGKISKGKKYEKKADSLYSKNYNKIFKIVKETNLQFGHSAFFKSKRKALDFKKRTPYSKMQKTTHVLRGKGYLVYK